MNYAKLQESSWITSLCRPCPLPRVAKHEALLLAARSPLEIMGCGFATVAIPDALAPGQCCKGWAALDIMGQEGGRKGGVYVDWDCIEGGKGVVYQ